ncbi:hypothetical protein BC940DRAFT_350377 [Gongronella butleri]|nr:hypothetical protein BC940DRAFT_350377 [Gongronella butleri]
MKRQRQNYGQGYPSQAVSDIEDSDDDDQSRFMPRPNNSAAPAHIDDVSFHSDSASPRSVRSSSPIDIFSDDNNDNDDRDHVFDRHRVAQPQQLHQTKISAWQRGLPPSLVDISSFDDDDDDDDIVPMASVEIANDPLLSPLRDDEDLSPVPSPKSRHKAAAPSAPAWTHIPNKPAAALPHRPPPTTTKTTTRPRPQTPVFQFAAKPAQNTTNAPKTKNYHPGGLAQVATRQISKERDAYRNWLTDVEKQLASFGSLARFCVSSGQGRLCRVLDMWMEHGQVLAWCLDLSDKDKAYLTQQNHHGGGSSNSSMGTNGTNAGSSVAAATALDDLIINDFSQPPALPAYDPDDNDRPYLCLFSLVHWPMRQRAKIQLFEADYVALWPPWANISLNIHDKTQHVHVITRFLLEDRFG